MIRIDSNIDDVNFTFYDSTRFYELLRSVEGRLRLENTFKLNTFKDTRLPQPRFTIDRAGNYKLFSQVKRGEVEVCEDSRCLDRNYRHQHHKFYPRRTDHYEELECEAYSEYHQSISDKYYDVSDNIIIKL